MCMVSVVGNIYQEKWQNNPWIQNPPFAIPQISRAEFEALRKEVQDLKKLLEAAKDYDTKHGEPDCETEDKMKLLRAVAKAVGVDLDEVIKAEVMNPS